MAIGLYVEVEQVSLEFVKLLRPLDEVEAVVLFGSHAARQARLNSDVDLLVITQTGFEQVSRHYKGQLFEVTFVTEESTRNWWRANPDHCVALWRSAKVLYAIADTGTRLKQFAEVIEKEGKPAMAVADAEKRYRAAAYQLVSLQALAAHDPPTANLVLGEKVAGYVGDFFAVRGLWSPAPKERLPMIRSIDHEVGALLDEFACPGLELDEKFAVARKLTNLIFHRTGKSDTR